MNQFVYIVRKPEDGGGIYVSRDRIISLAPGYSKLGEAVSYVATFDAGGGKVERGKVFDADLINELPRLPAPAGMMVNGNPVVFIQHQPEDEGGAVLAGVFDGKRITLVEIQVAEHVDSSLCSDPAAEAAVAEAERAAGGQGGRKAG